MADFDCLVFCLAYGFSKKKPIFAYKTSYFQFGTLKYIDVYYKKGEVSGKSYGTYAGKELAVVE